MTPVKRLTNSNVPNMGVGNLLDHVEAEGKGFHQKHESGLLVSNNKNDNKNLLKYH